MWPATSSKNACLQRAELSPRQRYAIKPRTYDTSRRETGRFWIAKGRLMADVMRSAFFRIVEAQPNDVHRDVGDVER